MNELDSELVAGKLRTLGYRFSSDPDSADVVLYNTCSVREHAEQKVWSRLGELAVRKRREEESLPPDSNRPDAVMTRCVIPVESVVADRGFEPRLILSDFQPIAK